MVYRDNDPDNEFEAKESFYYSKGTTLTITCISFIKPNSSKWFILDTLFSQRLRNEKFF